MELQGVEKITAGERYKKLMLGFVHWRFAHTAGTADYRRSHGSDRRRITTVQNAIDTDAFRALVNMLDTERG